MADKANSTVTTVQVEKHSGSVAKATVCKDGQKTSASGVSAEEALSTASNKLKDDAGKT